MRKMKDRQRKFLLFFSILFSAPVMALFIVFLFSRYCSNFFQTFLFGIFAFSFVPIIITLYYYKRGFVDIEVSDRKKRTPIYFASMLSQLFAIFYYYNSCGYMFFLALAYFFTTLMFMLINLKYKISAHSGNIAGVSMILYLVYGNIALPLFLLIIPIALLRLKMEAHSLGQIILGTLIGIICSYMAYSLVFGSFFINF